VNPSLAGVPPLSRVNPLQLLDVVDWISGSAFGSLCASLARGSVLDFGASCVKLACAESCRVGVGPWEEALVDKPSRFLYCLHAFASELTEDKPETIDSGHGRIDFSTIQKVEYRIDMTYVSEMSERNRDVQHQDP
jgi:hypothetical protein